MTAILCGIFFLSGASALIFETLWFHQTGLVFGNGVWASSLVLAAFMAGLALGNGAIARFGHRVTRPVRLYAVLEAVIAISGVAIVLGLPAMSPFLVGVLRPFLDVPWAANPIRLGAGFAVMLVPSIAMGATLPILVKALLARDDSFGSVLGRLYGWNTLGAVVGALAGEAFLLEWLGVHGSAYFAASLNVGVAVVALALSSRFVPGDAAMLPPGRLEVSPRARRLLAAAFFSGFCLLALEVVWFRFLLLFLHGSSLIFSVMLALVLVGIAVGSLATGAWLRRRPAAIAVTPLVSACAAIAVPVLYFAFQWLPVRETYIADWSDVVSRGAPLMLLPSLLSGAVFTMLGASLEHEIQPPTRAAGWMTLWNTLGSGAGSLVAGFILLPFLGIERAFFVLALLYGGVAWLALPLARDEEGRLPSAWAVPAGVLALALVLFPFGTMLEVFLPRAVDRYAKAMGGELIYVDEGRTETIALLRSSFLGQPNSTYMVTNGHGMAGVSHTALRYMRQYVQLPVAFEPEIRKALLISYGVGNTAGALVASESLEELHVVDISEDILAASPVIHPGEGANPLDDPRVRVHIEDGRYFLQTTDERFDLITSEPPPPKNAGIVNLYTREYFALARERLTEGGIMTYWLPVHNLLPGDARAIVAAWCEVYPDCTLWAGTSMDWMLMGSRDRDWSVDETTFGRQWQDASVRPMLREEGFERPSQLLATFMADHEQLVEFVGGTAPLVDRFPKRLAEESPLPRDVFPAFEPWIDAEACRERFDRSHFIATAVPEALREQADGDFAAQRVINHQTSVGAVLGRSPAESTRDLLWLLDETDLEMPVVWELGSSGRMLAIAGAVKGPGARQVGAIVQRGIGALARRDDAEASRLFRIAHAREPGNARILRLNLLALCRHGDFEEAKAIVQRFGKAFSERPGLRDFWAVLGPRCKSGS
jgi:predicted membrane-bound spermidine synthase